MANDMNSVGKCERCGGDMVPGVPGDVYCPNDECFRLDQEYAMSAWYKMRETEERKELARLKAKYGD